MRVVALCPGLPARRAQPPPPPGRRSHALPDSSPGFLHPGGNRCRLRMCRCLLPGQASKACRPRPSRPPRLRPRLHRSGRPHHPPAGQSHRPARLKSANTCTVASLRHRFWRGGHRGVASAAAHCGAGGARCWLACRQRLTAPGSPATLVGALPAPPPPPFPCSQPRLATSAAGHCLGVSSAGLGRLCRTRHFHAATEAFFPGVVGQRHGGKAAMPQVNMAGCSSADGADVSTGVEGCLRSTIASSSLAKASSTARPQQGVGRYNGASSSLPLPVPIVIVSHKQGSLVFTLIRARIGGPGP